MMPENERLHAAGARRLFDALRAAPQIDADTDEELDLFVCDLLSDVDKTRLEERIGRDPDLAEEVERRKADFAARLGPEQINKITGKMLDAIFAQGPDSLSVVPHQSLSTQQEPQETRSVFRPGWRLPGWLLIAAAFVVLIGLAVVIVNRRGTDQGIARNNSPDGPTPPSSPNAADIATVLGDQRKDQSVALNTGFEALLAKPEITESGLKLMGSENPEIERKYEGRTLSIVYFNRTKKKLPFALLPIQFEKKTTEIADEESRASISRLATFLKGFREAELRVTIEVHARVATFSESDDELSQNRAARLQSLLEGQGVPHSTFYEAKGFGTDSSRTLPPIIGDAKPSVLIIREH